MTFSRHTPCPACPIVWRNLYAASQVLAAALEEPGLFPWSHIQDCVANVQIALQHVTPIVEAHLENQDHALSPELVDARHVRTSTTLVLDRVLPFAGDDES